MSPDNDAPGPPHGDRGGGAYVALCRFNAGLERVLAYAAGAFLVLFTFVVAVDVFYRQILSQPLMWPSEWSVMAFVWSVLLGAAVSASRQSHFVVVILPDPPAGWDRLLRGFVALASVVFAFVLVWFGWHMTMGGTRRFTPMMGYPMFYVFAAFPVAGAAFLLFTVEQLLAALLGRPPRSAHWHAETDTP